MVIRVNFQAEQLKRRRRALIEKHKSLLKDDATGDEYLETKIREFLVERLLNDMTRSVLRNQLIVNGEVNYVYHPGSAYAHLAVAAGKLDAGYEDDGYERLECIIDLNPNDKKLNELICDVLTECAPASEKKDMYLEQFSNKYRSV